MLELKKKNYLLMNFRKKTVLDIKKSIKYKD